MKRFISRNNSIKPIKLSTLRHIAAVGYQHRGAGNGDKTDADEKADWFRRELAGNGDAVFRELMLGGREGLEAVLVYLYGNIDKSTLNMSVIKPLMEFDGAKGLDRSSVPMQKKIIEGCLIVGKISSLSSREAARDEIFRGKVILIVKGIASYISLEVGGGKARQVTEPENEKTLRGSKEGFIEDIWNNIAIIRKTLPAPDLKVELFEVGRRTKTKLSVIYLQSLADDKLVQEVKRRIKKIDIDGILANGYVEAFIEDNPYSPFPQAQGTEKPDKVAAALLEGRVAIVLDRTPLALLVPAQFVQFFQAPEDYFERSYMGTYIRILRVLAFIVTTTAAPAYIALTSFHPELVPLDLLLNIATLRKEVQFPPIVEALLMEFVIESLREAGLRLPTSVSTTLGVVGGIILGDAAVSSNLVSAAMIIVITITIICNFVIPNYSMSLVIRLLRLFLIIAAATFGAFGITLVWLMIIIHLCRLESFGLPYFSPLGPTRFRDLKDVFIRVPAWAMQQRPDSIPAKDKQRVKYNREKK
ncbi:MAG: spore germination protein [Pseudomonadota bacterium]